MTAAAQKLAESGIESGTLQRHLVRGEQPDAAAVATQLDQLHEPGAQ